MRTQTMLVLAAALLLLAAPSSGSAHPRPSKLLNPDRGELKSYAVLATGHVERKGSTYVGAAGVCRPTDRMQLRGEWGYRHVRCVMHTDRGHRFNVIFHATRTGVTSVSV